MGFGLTFPTQRILAFRHSEEEMRGLKTPDAALDCPTSTKSGNPKQHTIGFRVLGSGV